MNMNIYMKSKKYDSAWCFFQSIYIYLWDYIATVLPYGRNILEMLMKVHGDFGDVIPLVARLDSPIVLCCMYIYMYIYVYIYMYLISEELQFFYRNNKMWQSEQF